MSTKNGHYQYYEETDTALLRASKRKLAARGKHTKSLNGMARLRAENQALRTQIVNLQVQWDILKTTLGVLSTTVCSHETA